MEFLKTHFDPAAVADAAVQGDGSVSVGRGTAPGDVYVYSPNTILALNVALSTGRPLLVTGEPGSGKTTLAQNAARILGWWFHRETITSRAQATDLFYQFDALRRLNDANTPTLALAMTEAYIEPGVLWWAFAPESAVTRGNLQLPAGLQSQSLGIPPRPATDGTISNNAVVLLDEIDKADPDVPNDLLEAFESRRFTVRETGRRIDATGDRRVLMMLTTNGERELPPAFLRRCVMLALPAPTADFFTLVADERFGAANTARHKAIATEVMNAREEARKRGLRMPSTAEFLDAVQACEDLGIEMASAAWKQVTNSVLIKSDKL